MQSEQFPFGNDKKKNEKQPYFKTNEGKKARKTIFITYSVILSNTQ